jgi:polyhydroxybutyrate depolymerase
MFGDVVVRFVTLSVGIAFSASAMAAEAKLHSDAGQTVDRTIKHADHERSYLLHVPAELPAGKSAPLIIALHGLSMDGQSMEALTGFSELADEKGFVVAYPDGLGRMWRFWERHELGLRVRREAGYADDVGFIEAIIDTLVDEKLVDARRVYVTGLSNGAYMSNRLAISLSDRVAAIAPVAGTMSEALSALQPPRPMPVLYIHGTDDHIVGFNGADRFTRRKSSLSAEELVEWWAKRNGCALAEPPKTLKDSAADGCTVTLCHHPCDKDAPVDFYEIEQGGHTWPDGSFQPELLLGPVCRDFNASAAIWEFCSRFTLPETATAVRTP